MIHQYWHINRTGERLLGDVGRPVANVQAVYSTTAVYSSLSFSHVCLCVNCIMMYILTNISHPDPVASLRGQCACLPHMPLVCGSGGICVYASSWVTVCSKERSSKITLHCGVKADRDTHLQSSRQHAWNDKPMQQAHSGGKARFQT